MEDALYDSESMRRFAVIDLGDDTIPDETTITRHYLSAKGLLVREGTIVDATIINAPSSTKNRDRSRYAKMRQIKKGNPWYFGMKAHVGTDTRRGLVHRVVVTDTSAHDSRVMDELLHGEERAIYGDKEHMRTKGRRWNTKHGVLSGVSTEKPSEAIP